MLIAGLTTLLWDLEHIHKSAAHIKKAFTRRPKAIKRKTSDEHIVMEDFRNRTASAVPFMADMSLPPTPAAVPCTPFSPSVTNDCEQGFPFPASKPNRLSVISRPSIRRWQSDAPTLAASLHDATTPPATTTSARPKINRYISAFPSTQIKEENESREMDVVTPPARPHFGRQMSDFQGERDPSAPAQKRSRPALARWQSDYSAKASQSQQSAKPSRPQLARWQSDFSAKEAPTSPGPQLSRPALGRSQIQRSVAQRLSLLSPMLSPSPSRQSQVERSPEGNDGGGFPFPKIASPPKLPDETSQSYFAGAIPQSPVTPLSRPNIQRLVSNQSSNSLSRKFRARISLPSPPLKRSPSSTGSSPTIHVTPPKNPVSSPLTTPGLSPPASDRSSVTYVRKSFQPAKVDFTETKDLELGPADDIDDCPKIYTIPEMSWQTGTFILASFAVLFVLTVALHATILAAYRAFSLFASSLLAGTIIFGGLYLLPPSYGLRCSFPFPYSTSPDRKSHANISPTPLQAVPSSSPSCANT